MTETVGQEVETFLEQEGQSLAAKRPRTVVNGLNNSLGKEASPKEGSTKQSLSTGVVNGAGDESSSTYAGASVKLKQNGTMVFKKLVDVGSCYENGSGEPDEHGAANYNLRH